MNRIKYMIKSSERGISLSTFLLLSLALLLIPSAVYAAGTINAKSVSFEETTIIEFTNNGKDDVNSFRIWPDSGFNFKSFKTEKGWIGEITPQGVISFTSSKPVKSSESIKIGIKIDKSSTGINWKALDKNQNQLDIGKTIPGELSHTPNMKSTEPSNGVLSSSVFRIIPEKPNAGSTIRVIGDNFGASQQLDFYIDTKKIGTFETDGNGYFITTMKIPEDQSADRVDFSVKDTSGLEKKISIRVGQIQNRIPQDNVKLTIRGIPDIVHRGDPLEISGTAQPNNVVTGSIKDSESKIINTRTAPVDSKGNWKLDEPIIVPIDAPFGKYSVSISDGIENQTAYLNIESSKLINLVPTILTFNPGEIIKFNGTAIPNKPIAIVLKDPLGEEKLSDVIQVNGSGKIEVEYKTIANVDKEGTWTLIATQDKNKEFSFAGLGSVPIIPINFQFDKQNYKSTEIAVITVIGESSEKLTMLIIDPADKPKGQPIPITLGADGRQMYNLDLKGYTSGAYTAIISKGSTKSTEIFTVGLQEGSGEIKINSTKLEYSPGDPILLLGKTNPNILFTISLVDPNGKTIKTEETFSDKNGNISNNQFRVPFDAKPGKWKISAKSGANFDSREIEIITAKEIGMVITAIDGKEISGFGKSIDIKIVNAARSVQIDIISSNGKIIDTLKIPASSNGEVKLPWFIPRDTLPGTYTIKVKDANNSTQTTFQIK